MRILIKGDEMAHFNSFDSDAALNAARARRAEVISYVPRSARVWAVSDLHLRLSD